MHVDVLVLEVVLVLVLVLVVVENDVLMGSCCLMSFAETCLCCSRWRRSLKLRFGCSGCLMW